MLSNIKYLLFDYRTIIHSILMPLFLVPLVVLSMASVWMASAGMMMTNTIKIALVDNDNGQVLLEDIENRADVELIRTIPEDSIAHFIREDSIDLGLIIDSSFDEAFEQKRTAEITLLSNQSGGGQLVKDRFQRSIDRVFDKELKARLDSLGINPTAIEPIFVNEQNVFDISSQINKMLGMVLPFILVLFAFLGIIYPTIHLFTNDIDSSAIKKTLAVSFMGVLSAMLVVISLYLSFNVQVISAFSVYLEDMANIQTMPIVVLLLFLALIPFVAFFGRIIKAVKRFKHGQIIMQIAGFFVFLFLMGTMNANLELTTGTVFIPLLNVALASRAIFLGTISYGLLGMLFLVLIGYASLGLFLIKEKVIF